MINALEAYALLRQIGAKPAEFQSRETGVEIADQPVQHAIDSQGLPLLLVPLGQEEPDIQDLNSKGVSLTTHDFPQHETLVRTLVVRCLDPRLERQFFLMVDDMVGALNPKVVASGTVCLQVLTRWRELFEPNQLALLSSSAQLGLLAELHVLETLIENSPEAGFNAWAGPSGGRHDFVTEKYSVEVKATTHRDSLTVKIHGAMQLDDNGLGNLSVYVEQMEFSPTGESLPDAIDRIAGKVVDQAALFQNLRQVGYRLEDAEGYRLSRMVVLRARLCMVDQDFPRIIAASMKQPIVLDRIERLEYAIDVGPLPSPVSDEQALRHVQRLLS